MSSVEVPSKDALNTSDHVPVTVTLCTPAGKSQPTTEMVKCKPKWKKCNNQIYKQSIKNIQHFSIFQVQSNSEIDTLKPLGHLNAVLN